MPDLNQDFARESSDRTSAATGRLAALVRIFGREACRDPRFVAWLVARVGR